jgi:SAM-dependent methyltransferase
MPPSQPDLLAEVASYYGARIGEFGETPRGVDWNGEAGQTLRFEQLCRVFQGAGPLSLCDLGCGYGALVDYLAARHPGVSYLGVDISGPMIEAARRRYQQQPETRFLQSSEPDTVCDYALASGIFNVRLTRSPAEWSAYVTDTIEVLHRSSRLGFAFNCLTSYSDADRMRADLHYADPCALFDLCKRRYARDVALLHDYGLYEFTILVKKKP